jgi:hypothetical protein
LTEYAASPPDIRAAATAFDIVFGEADPPTMLWHIFVFGERYERALVTDLIVEAIVQAPPFSGMRAACII